MIIGAFAPNGDILAANDTANGNWTYTYDPFNRLVGSNKNSGAAVYSYVYDRFGNRWQQNGPQTFLATFTGNNQGNPQNNNRMDGYSYDAAGNLLNDGTHSYTYDAENRLIKVDNGTTAAYTYDADGNRVQKVSATGGGGDPAGTWQFLYDQSGRMLQRFDGTFWQGNIYVGGRHLVEDGGGTNFSHSDWLGTERVRTSFQTGAICESIASLPFGDGQTTTGACYQSSPLHFTGKERDSESGLDNFEARYNSSSMGRFMSPDPITVTPGRIVDPQQLNLYSYVKNNPLSFTDPTGMIIDTSDLSDKDKKLWQKVVDLANQQDANGNYVNPTLHDAYSKLDSDSRTFKIEDDKSLGESRAGGFEITKFNGPNDFSEAKVELNFNVIKGISSTTKGDFDPSFNKYEGLFGKNGFINRLAETFGHEGGGHGLFAIHDPAFAVYTQHLVNDANAAFLAANRSRSPIPPDVIQKIQQKDLVLVPSERFAQQQEKIINGELRANPQ